MLTVDILWSNSKRKVIAFLVQSRYKTCPIRPGKVIVSGLFGSGFYGRFCDRAGIDRGYAAGSRLAKPR